MSFTLDEVVGVEARTSEGTKDAVKTITEDALAEAVKEGILERKTFVCDNESDGQPVTKYAFYHAVWRTALLNIMLEGRKRDLHRVLAETLEDQDVGVGDYMFNTKLFNHWINSGNFGKSAQLAVALGKHFEERLGLPAQSIRLYNESLGLLREARGSETTASIGGEFQDGTQITETNPANIFFVFYRFFNKGFKFCWSRRSYIDNSITGCSRRSSCDGSANE